MARSPGQAKPFMLQSFFRRLCKTLLWFVAASVALVVIFRFIPPPGTMLMAERKIESWVDGQPIDLQRTGNPGRTFPTI